MKKKKIDAETLKFWNEVRPDTSLEEMNKKTGLSFSTLSHAFTDKKATQTTITKINDFMLKKKLELQAV